MCTIKLFQLVFTGCSIGWAIWSPFLMNILMSICPLTSTELYYYQYHYEYIGKSIHVEFLVNL